MLYKIYAGLSGGFGGANYITTNEYDNEEQASEDAYQYACEIYDDYAGMHGLRSEVDIAEDESLDIDEDYEEIRDIYLDEMESWIDY